MTPSKIKLAKKAERVAPTIKTARSFLLAEELLPDEVGKVMVMVDVEKGGGVLICVAGVEVGKKVQDEQSSGILSSKLEISSNAGGRDLYVILSVVGSLGGRSITAMSPTDVSTVVVIVSLSAREESVICAVALDRLEVRMRSELA